MKERFLTLFSACLLLCSVVGFAIHIQLQPRSPAARPGERIGRGGDEIVVCGQFFHTGAPVVTWMDPQGYDAYRVEPRFAPFDKSSWSAASHDNPELKPVRYDLRKDGLTPEQIEHVRGGGWDLPLLQQVVDQFVLHYDQSGTSRRCFRTLHDRRCLSVHFMLDLDGTIYQTLDLKERAWHATRSNSRSIGIEIANVGAYPAAKPSEKTPLDEWYERDTDGTMRIKLPVEAGGSGLRTPGFVGRPSRNERVAGRIQGQDLEQYDLTPQQYESLIKLTAALCRIFPKLRCDYPRDVQGNLVREKLPDEQLDAYRGILGHYHVQTNKIDPGPAIQWEKIITGTRELIEK